ncbi:MAG: head-tail connector protein, partial [Rickettsiales bacterium]|nr:head-tail connector protein [Rickettsiales bacterium]
MNKKLLELYKSAIDARSAWVGRWRQCRRYAMPETDADNAALFDSTAADAADMLAANIFSLLTPPESAWLGLARESELSPDPAEPEAMLRAHLNDSNFYTTAHQCYLDLAILGTACLSMTETPIGSASAFSFAAIPMPDIAVLRDSADEITAVFHTTEMPAGEVAERYPAWTPPAHMRRAIAENPSTPIRLIQSVVKNKNYDFTAWLDAGGDIENNIVATGTFATNPYIIFRWSAASGEIYGRSPVMRALPDIKTANKVVELVLKNATIAVSGIWQADDDGIINLQNINLTPGAIIPKAVGSGGLTPLKSGADFDVSQLVLNDLRDRIRRAMLADRMTIVNDKEMTATEIVARNTDMMRILGATYGRILNEMLRPLIERGLFILGR